MSAKVTDYMRDILRRVLQQEIWDTRRKSVTRLKFVVRAIRRDDRRQQSLELRFLSSCHRHPVVVIRRELDGVVLLNRNYWVAKYYHSCAILTNYVRLDVRIKHQTSTKSHRFQVKPLLCFSADKASFILMILSFYNKHNILVIYVYVPLVSAHVLSTSP